jgi:DNA segregation ATPase FtsK/SpoIIIE, S-DNA-T family
MAAAARTARSSPGPDRQLVSPGFRALARRRAAELTGLALGFGGLVLLVALVSYDARDPSFDTASDARAHNLAGPLGAGVADLLLQIFGLAGALPGVAMLCLAWRVASHRGVGSRVARLLAVLAGTPVLAAALSELPVAHWPASAGLGGAGGTVLARAAIAAGSGVLGPVGAILVTAIGWALAATLVLLACGLTGGEWRAALRGLKAVCRFSVSTGWSAALVTARVAQASGILTRPFRRLAEYGDKARPDRLEEQRPWRAVPPAPDGPAEPSRPAAPQVPPAVSATPSVVARVLRPAQAATRTPQASVPPPEPTWRFPSLSLLKSAPVRAGTGPSKDTLEANARLLETVLSDYGVQGSIVEIRPGPVVTLYELEPAPGIRSARVIGLADDVARSLSVTAVRIATVPGRNVIGIEVPNAKRETVFLSELLASEEVQRHAGRLVLALGKDIGGTAVVADLQRMPHLMIAGTTGSGKSVGVNAMILSLLYRLSPEQCRLILIDPKMLELSTYEGIPHLMAPVVTEPAKAVTALKWTVREMERRYRAMSQLGVRNIGGYNDRVAEARSKGEVVTRRVQTGFDPDTGRPTFEEQPLTLEQLPLIVVVVDEMADLMMVAGKEIEAAVQRLAQMARAAGIHVIMATQRPSVDVITGTIKANFPTRISFQVISKFDSRTILGEQGAEQLLGQGDMLYMAGGGRITRVHGPFVSDQEVEAVVNFLREQGEPAYVESVTEPEEDDPGGALSGLAMGDGAERGLYEQAVALVAREGKASTSFVQRHLNIGYNRAAKLVEQMEREGIVGPANHVGKREVLVRRTADE